MNRRARLVVFTVLILVGITAAVLLTKSSTSDAISPGRLSAAHAAAGLDVGEKCSECHVGGGGGLDDDLCLKCHETLAERVEQKQGYHAKLEGKSCQDCHGEHLGVEASIVRWPAPEKPFEPGGLDAAGKRIERKVFPHSVAVGFPLEGAHEKLECEKCHRPGLILDPKVIEFSKVTVASGATPAPGAPTTTTHLGLGKDCATCHVDAHAPTFGKDCAQCHVAATWERAERFVHDKTRFPLEGKHETVDCAKCHLQPATSKPPAAPKPPVPTFTAIPAPAAVRPFKGVGFGAAPAKPVTGDTLPVCQSCHASPHRAGSQAFDRCESCHTEADWKNGGRVAAAATFDHGKTSFALTGAHQQVTCTKCHDPKLDRAARTSCVDCHEDKHKGAFDREVAIARKSCDLCHSTAAWKPDSYAKDKHPLPLIEGHAVKCESCHGKEVKFARLPARPPASVGPLEESCKNCHEDVHKGKLSQDCASCHGFKSFHLAELSVEKHAEIGFPIREAHLKVTCDQCHGGRAPEGGLRRLSLAEARTQGCVACHTDAHRGQFTQQGAAQDCKSCHGETHFSPSNYDEARHARARFALTGAHKAVPCEVCHVKDLGPEPLVQRFHWDQKQRCDTCHQKDDPHRGQFKGTDCASCHAAEAWSPSSFTREAHAKTGFQLVGGHDKACNACHPGAGGASAFRDTPRECSGCHLDPHAGQFQGRGGVDGCGRCHGLADWKPTFFDHDAPPTRFALTGKHKEIGCNACHVSSSRAVPGGGTRNVAHFFPIEERACDDCHVNPHAQQEKEKR